jgi:hypothetical protein
MSRGEGIVCHPVYFQYHNTNLQMLFEQQLGEVSASEARDRIDQLLRAGWPRRDGTFATYIEMIPDQPEGWKLDLVGRELQILRPDDSSWPARRIQLCARIYMEGPDGPRRGEALKMGRPTATIFFGPPATVVMAGTVEEEMAIRDFNLYGVPFATRIPPTRNEEIEIAIDRACEVLRHEPLATNPELFEKAIKTKNWLSMPRPTPRSRAFKHIMCKARERSGVAAKLGRPRA